MAQLVLKNVDPSIVHKLEQRAKRLGSTVEAVAVRLLEIECQHVAEHLDGGAGGVVDADFDGSEQDAGTAGEASSPPGPSSGTSEGTRALGDRQAALAEAYPDEYVVLVGERILAHTMDKDEAYAHYDAAFEEGGTEEPLVIPPGALRRIGPPLLRGRALSTAFGVGRR